MQHKISDPRGSITLPFVFHHRHREKRKIGHGHTRTHTDTHGHFTLPTWHGKNKGHRKFIHCCVHQWIRSFVCVSLCASVAKINLLQRKTFLLSGGPTIKKLMGFPLCSPCLSGETSLYFNMLVPPQRHRVHRGKNNFCPWEIAMGKIPQVANGCVKLPTGRYLPGSE